MNFLERILDRLGRVPQAIVLQEVRDGRLLSASAGELLGDIRAARAWLRQAGVKKGDRCALLAHNSIRWVALDLAMMAEGAIVVPLYARQAAAELVGILRDSAPVLVACGDSALRDAIAAHWPAGEAAPRLELMENMFPRSGSAHAIQPDLPGWAVSTGEGQRPIYLASPDALPPLTGDCPVTVIYTSGTSGLPKGVVLTVANLDFMLPRTMERLDQLMVGGRPPDQVFHYLPFNFAGSWILLLTSLSRNSCLAMSTDLTRLADEIPVARPHYFLNVPALLDRVRKGVEEKIAARGGFAAKLFADAGAAFARRREGKSGPIDTLWLALADRLIFRAVRRKMGGRLRALICGSAPLNVDTQLFFMMLGIPVLQVYGLTETTAICTMDDPRGLGGPRRGVTPVVPGRVGPAIPGIEMKLGENGEILVSGPNIFPGYWNRPAETAEVLRGVAGEVWFHTGDQGEVDEHGNWRIIGRVKNLIVLSSGHNVPPEPLEEAAQQAIPGAVQVFVVGHARSYLTALVTGEVDRSAAQAALDKLNHTLPHYRRIRAFHISAQPFTIENGLLTANGKLKRGVILEHYRADIEALYRQPAAQESKQV
jgi:long-chain acyl-CoA synthetase